MCKLLALYVPRQQRLAAGALQSKPYPFAIERGEARPAGKDGETDETFEEAYPKYPFAELVRLGVAFAELVGSWRRKPLKRPETRQWAQ